VITPEYCQTLARYNAWQNNGIRKIVDVMSEEDLRQERGAFFGTIMGTLNHLLYDETVCGLCDALLQSPNPSPRADTCNADSGRAKATRYRFNSYAGGLGHVDDFSVTPLAPNPVFRGR